MKNSPKNFEKIKENLVATYRNMVQNSNLQINFDETELVVSNILKLDRVQDQLLLLLYCIPGRVQHLLAAVPMSVSRDFANKHDKLIQSAVADVLGLGELTERDLLQIQRKVSNHGLGLRSMENNLPGVLILFRLC